MRCLQCKNFCKFSFMDEVNERPVYQCGTVGVEANRTIGGRTDLIHTLDHSDHYFTYIFGKVEQVTPRRLGRQMSEAILKKKGWVFEKLRGHKVVPTCWTAVRV